MKLETIILPGTDPYFNLACEQYIFDEMPKDRSYLMLWQNENTIVVGKFQNTFAEINAEYVAAHHIHVARRLSGGGAVYHDLGNLNYTMITDAGDLEKLNMKLFCEPVVRALKGLGAAAEINGRNDIIVDGKKFSGNSQYICRGRVMHHGTILFDSDLDTVSKALRVDGSKIQAKGIQSVRSRVTNVRPYLTNPGLTLQDFRDCLLREMEVGFDSEKLVLSEADLTKISALREKYAGWDWNYGKSPECTVCRKKRFENCGEIEADIQVEKGITVNVRFYGDFFSCQDPEIFEDLLKQVPARREAYLAVLEQTDPSRFFFGIDRQEFIDFITGWL